MAIATDVLFLRDHPSPSSSEPTPASPGPALGRVTMSADDDGIDAGYSVGVAKIQLVRVSVCQPGGGSYVEVVVTVTVPALSSRTHDEDGATTTIGSHATRPSPLCTIDSLTRRDTTPLERFFGHVYPVERVIKFPVCTKTRMEAAAA